MEERREAAPTACSACQAVNEPGARVCYHCGMSLLAGVSASQGSGLEADDLVQATSGERSTPPPMPAAHGGAAMADTADRAREVDGDTSEQRRCQWCGAANPAHVEQCRQCGAMFPRPEQDAALLRAAEERLRAANDTLNMMRRRRSRRGFGRFIDG